MNMQETLDLVKKSLTESREDLVSKAFTQATGLVGYDLQAPALALYPFVAAMTMLRNDIPRVAGHGDTATRWKAITAINANNTSPFVSEGNRGALIATTVQSYTAAYVGLGLEDSVTFEADYAAVDFDDPKARATLGLLRSLMIQEEGLLLGGNASQALGTTPTPTLSAAGTGGSLPAATYSVIAVALAQQGASRSSLNNGVVGQIIKTNADGSTDTINGGASQKSANATQAVTLGQTLSASVGAVDGATSYAWYIGPAGNERLEFITGGNSLVVSAPLNGTRQLASTVAAADYSHDAVYSMDGMLSWARSSNGAIVKTLGTGVPGTGTGFTSDGSGGVLEINDALQQMYDTSRIGPSDILVSSAGIRTLNKICIGNGGAPLFRFVMDINGDKSGLAAGATVGSYLNPITNTLIRIRVHPFMPSGTLLGYSKEIPYPLNGVGNVMQVKTRKEYYSLQWPFRTRRFEYGVYVDELLQHFAPFSLLKITNVANA